MYSHRFQKIVNESLRYSLLYVFFSLRFYHMRALGLDHREYINFNHIDELFQLVHGGTSLSSMLPFHS